MAGSGFSFGRGGGGKPKPVRTPWQKVVYWGAVLGVWAAIFLVVFFAVFARDLPDTSTLYNVDRQPSITYLDRNGALIAVRGTQQAPPADLDALPDYVPAAFIAIEDRRFYHHPGFDPIGMSRAMAANMRAGRVVQGGSTLTQQLAKNLFLSGSRSYIRKGQELIIAFMLESVMSKERILELYLNVVEYGRGIFGAEAAARHYFNTTAARLGSAQAARLAVMLPNPRYYDKHRDTRYLARRTSLIVSRMNSAELP